MNDISIETNLKEKNDSEKLLDITCTENNFSLITNEININKLYEPSNKKNNFAWFIFNSIKNEGQSKKYLLNEGDIIKIGRIILKIKRIKLNISELNNNNNNKNTNHSQLSNSLNTNLNNPQTENLQTSINLKYAMLAQKTEISTFAKKKNKRKKICRICFEEDNEPDSNPLIYPCNCRGSMKYIHLNCLKQCISSKSCVKINSNDNYTIYNLKTIECELCKEKIPDFIKIDDKLYEILNFNSEYKNFIIIESLSQDRHKNKYLYVINLDNKDTIKIGRGHDSNLLLSDISVSRFHCSMTLEKSKIYLQDNDSKFGTLILIQNNSIKLNNDLPLNIQIGRTFCHFRVKKKFKLFTCCNIDEKVYLNYYQLQNIKTLNKHKYIIKNNNILNDDSSSSIEEDKNINDIKSNNLNDNNEIATNIKENFNDEINNNQRIQNTIENEINDEQLEIENKNNVFMKRKTMINE